MRPANSPATVLAKVLGKAVILGPDGRDITRPVRASFARMLPTCGGDRGAAAAQAVRAALAERETDR
jgi:hypothetical protein